MGGIATAEDALEFILAGATAVSIGTANFHNPRATLDVIEGIEKYMIQKGVNDINDLIGIVIYISLLRKTRRRVRNGRLIVMINIAICDDESQERECIKDLLVKYSVKRKIELNIDLYSSGNEIIEKYVKGRYEVIFMDVEMGDSDGIITADRIRKIPDHDVNIMYVSNYPEYMQQSFDVRAAQFLLKPVRYELLESKLDKLFEYMNEEKTEKICFENALDIYILNIPDILFIKTEKILGSNSDLRIVTAREDIIIKGKLKSIESQYGKDFIMPNRSVLVNINHIIKMLRNKIELDNGEIITISRKRATEIKPVVIEKLRRDMKK